MRSVCLRVVSNADCVALCMRFSHVGHAAWYTMESVPTVSDDKLRRQERLQRRRERERQQSLPRKIHQKLARLDAERERSSASATTYTHRPDNWIRAKPENVTGSKGTEETAQSLSLRSIARER